MKFKLVMLLIISVLMGVAFSGCGSSTSTSGDSSAPVSQVDTTSSWSDVFDANAVDMRSTMCPAYFSLVNQGWAQDDIYDALNDAGAFDNYYGQGHEAFKAMTKWCYENAS